MHSGSEKCKKFLDNSQSQPFYQIFSFFLQRDENKLKLMLVWMTISWVLALLRILSFTFNGFSQGLVGFVLYGYSFLVLHSLREKFCEEFSQGISMQINAQQYATQPKYVQAAYAETSAEAEPQPYSYQQNNPQPYMQPQAFNQP
jgi:hypothetical protein